MKAIPLPIQFIQYYIEEYQFKGHPVHNTWEYKHEFRYEDLYQVFIEYQRRIGVTKSIPLNTFRDCISKRFKFDIYHRDRKCGIDKKYYTLGDSPEHVLCMLKEKGLYNKN